MGRHDNKQRNTEDLNTQRITGGNTAGRKQTQCDKEEAKLNTLNTQQGTIKIKQETHTTQIQDTQA